VESSAAADHGVVPPEIAPVRPGEELDWEALDAYLRGELPELTGPFSVLQFPNGSANLTYLVTIGERRLVVRRPPFGVIAPGAHDMGREYRTLSRLWRGYAPAPRAYAFCDDHAVVGSDFLVIEYRPGVVVWGAVPPAMQHHADVARRIGFAVVDGLARLHQVEPASVGLEDLGHPDGFVERQVAGWAKRWSLVAGPDAPRAMDVVADRLGKTIPRSARASILHNDYKLDNCQFDPRDPDRVTSVFDWDMATLGDPLVDLGTLLNYWPDPSDTEENRPIYNPGMELLGLPTRAEVVEWYAASASVDVEAASWYEAFACWKTAVVLQQLYMRYVRGESTDERMATRGEKVSAQAQRAMTILDAGGLA
jgi:aminoglycoside phosphotransferase (APT) family kinase protein